MNRFIISKQTLFSLLQSLGSSHEIKTVGLECGFTMSEYEKWDKQEEYRMEYEKLSSVKEYRDYLNQLCEDGHGDKELLLGYDSNLAYTGDHDVELTDIRQSKVLLKE